MKNYIVIAILVGLICPIAVSNELLCPQDKNYSYDISQFVSTKVFAYGQSLPIINPPGYYDVVIIAANRVPKLETVVRACTITTADFFENLTCKTISTDYDSALSSADIDKDGDLDLLTSSETFILKYDYWRVYVNTAVTNQNSIITTTTTNGILDFVKIYTFCYTENGLYAYSHAYFIQTLSGKVGVVALTHALFSNVITLYAHSINGTELYQIDTAIRKDYNQTFVVRGNYAAVFGTNSLGLGSEFMYSFIDDVSMDHGVALALVSTVENRIFGGSSAAFCDLKGNGEYILVAIDKSENRIVFIQASTNTRLDDLDFDLIRIATPIENITISCALGIDPSNPALEFAVICPVDNSCVVLSYSSSWKMSKILPGIYNGNPSFMDLNADGNIDAVVTGTSTLTQTQIGLVFMNSTCPQLIRNDTQPQIISSSESSNSNAGSQIGSEPFSGSIPGDNQGLTGGEIALIVVGSVLLILLVIGVLVGVMFFGRWTARRNKGVSVSLPLEDVALAGLIRYECNDSSQLGMTISPNELLFGSSSMQLQVDKEYHDSFTIQGTTTKTTDFRFILPKPEAFKYSMKVSTIEGITSVSRGNTVQVDVCLCMLCTTSISVELAIVLGSSSDKNKGKGKGKYTTVGIRASSQLSTKLDANDLEFGEALGTGSFGTVYRGKFKSTVVAIKSYNESVFQNEILRGDVDREVEMCVALRNNHIITFYGKALLPDKYYLVMELAEIGSLGGLVKKGPLDGRFKIRAILDVARGMDFLHKNNVIHRDLKTDNVLICSMDPNAPVVAKLSDFGTSRFMGTDAQRTKTKGVGTPIFMAPEVLDGKKYNQTSDIYSFAVLVWNVWTQQEPYTEFETQFAIFKHVLDGNRLPIPSDMPNELKSVMIKAWNQDQSKRIPFSEIVNLLENFPKTKPPTKAK